MTPQPSVAAVVCALCMIASAAARAAEPCIAHGPEAARRSGLPLATIVRVMRAESAGQARAVSHRGAMGCMQIMPATWRELAARYSLGSDPFEPRANMIAGALYLADLARQFGFPGAYAAYNAGPGRYMRSLAEKRPLPRETMIYVSRLSDASYTHRIRQRDAWPTAALFISSASSSAMDATASRPASGSLFPDLQNKIDESLAVPLQQRTPPGN